jgi:predicted small secreted protein
MRKLVTLISLTTTLMASLAVSGCNTMRGFGKDVERSGERVQDAAKPKEGTQQPAR